MLFEQIFGLISTFRSKSDAQLTVGVNLGAGFAPSILGLKQLVFEALSLHSVKITLISTKRKVGFMDGKC